MPCPACGGTDRRPIAPGLWECQTVRTINSYMPAPGEHAGTVPLIPEFLTSVCGHRYQDQAAPPGTGSGGIPACACGMFAVAACRECGTSLCGDHLVRWDGQVFCIAHMAALESKARASQAESGVTIYRNGWNDFIGWVGPVTSDAVERFLLAVIYSPRLPRHGDSTKVMAVLDEGLDRLLGPDRRSWTSAPDPDTDTWRLDTATLIGWAFARADPALIEQVKFRANPLNWRFTVTTGRADGVYVGDWKDDDPDHYHSPRREYLLRDGTKAQTDEKRNVIGSSQKLDQINPQMMRKVATAFSLAKPPRIFGDYV